LMRQLDAGAGYRSEIEKEITKRIGEAPVVSASAGSKEQDPADDERGHALGGVGRVLHSRAAGTCASCGTSNDADARFCKHCGHSIEARS
jgi:zinc-ribbon domain